VLSSQKPMTQADLETVILPALAKAKQQSSLHGKQFHLAEWLTGLGYKPDFNNINFSILNLTISQISPYKTGTIYHGTDLLKDIDYEGCGFNQCNFSDCNFSDSRFGKNQIFNKCTLANTIMQNSVVNSVKFVECIMPGICFDSSSLMDIRFVRSDMKNGIFSFLIYATDIHFQDCDLNGVNFSSGVMPKNCSIAYSEPTVIKNIHLFDKQFKLINAEIGARKNAIGLIWYHQEHGYLANCARQSILAKGMQPILIDYVMPVKKRDLFQLEAEVKYASELVKQIQSSSSSTSSKKSFTMLLFEVIHGNSQQFPLMMQLVNYTRLAIKDLDGLIVPGGADINPLMYGAELHPETRPMLYKEEKNKIYYDYRRDIIDFSILYHQAKMKVPLYGICRGSQIIALYYGATFYQHIGFARKRLGETFNLEKHSQPRSNISNMTAFMPKLIDAKQDTAVGPRVAFLHHQAYDFHLTAEAALFDILATTIVNDTRITLAAESLARNIFLVQFHPEMVNDIVLSEQLSIDAKLASSFLDGFASCVDLYMTERNNESLSKHASLRHLHLITTPRYQQEKIIDNLSFYTVIIGMNAVALAGGLSALARGEKIAFVTDAPKDYRMPVQKDFISENVFAFIKSLLLSSESQDLLKKYFDSNQITKASDPKTGYSVSAQSLENLCLIELKNRQASAGNAVVVVEVSGLDMDLIDRINMDRQAKISQQYLRGITALRHIQDVDVTRGVLSLSCVHKIDEKTVANNKAVVKLHFTNLQIFNGKDQKIEKGMLEISSDQIVSNFPVVPYHMSVFFSMKDAKDPAAQLDKVTPVPLRTLEKDFAWESTSRPYSKIFLTDSSSSFYLNAELPLALYLALYKADNQDAVVAAKKAIYRYAIALLQDFFPLNVIKHNIEIQFERHFDISVFQLDFSQLSRTFIPVATDSMQDLKQNKKPGMVTFFGNGAVSPLSVSRSSLELSMEMLVEYNRLQSKVSDSPENVGEMLRAYHVSIRSLLDRNREDMQGGWINDRNARQVVSIKNAQLNTYIQLLSHDATQFLDLKLVDVNASHELQAILDELNKLYISTDKVIAYEDFMKELGFNDKLGYFNKVKQVCDQLERFMEEKISLLPQVGNGLVENYLIKNAERLVLINYLCESQLHDLNENLELSAVNQSVMGLFQQLAGMIDHKSVSVNSVLFNSRDAKDQMGASNQAALRELLDEYKKILVPLDQVNSYSSFVSQINYKNKLHYYEHLKELNDRLVADKFISKDDKLLKVIESINKTILQYHPTVNDHVRHLR
jgi:putative glutamine amidotransferase